MSEPKQYPPRLRKQSLGDRARELAERQRRDVSVGYNRHYEYAVGINFIQLSGKVTREPQVRGEGRWKQTTVVFRLSVPNQDNPAQWFFTTVRCRGALAAWAWKNITKGDIVMVVGRIWTGTQAKHSEDGELIDKRSLPIVIAERISSSYPVQVDNDPRFVRVRRDLWERAGEFLRDVDLTDIPRSKRQQLLDEFANIAQVDDDVVTEVSIDPEPDNPKPTDFPPCAP